MRQWTRQQRVLYGHLTTLAAVGVNSEQLNGKNEDGSSRVLLARLEENQEKPRQG